VNENVPPAPVATVAALWVTAQARVCVSAVPGSVNVPEYDSGWPRTPAAGPVIVTFCGATLLTVTTAVYSDTPPSLSRTFARIV
jgi:hypothetical protein